MQVLLLTLGVVLISVTAVVFLFVAYLVASLEVRSVIIAAASVLVLGLAWLLRARRLPGTAEGVASVAVVLLLLDVWIVRANALFGTDAVDAAAYTGVAFAIVGGVLAAVRAVSGIRVPGFAASALAPAAAFLLGYAIDPQTATGVWIGGLAAVLVAAVAAALAPRSPERAILLAAGLAGGAVSFVVAAVGASRPPVERDVDPPRGGGRLHAHRRRSPSSHERMPRPHGAGRPPPRPARRSRSRPPSGSSPNWTSRSRRGSRRRSRGR